VSTKEDEKEMGGARVATTRGRDAEALKTPSSGPARPRPAATERSAASSAKVLRATATLPSSRTWIAERTGKHAGLRLGWRYLKRLNYSLQQPQTQHGAANLEAQDAFKKRSNRSSTTSRVSSPKQVSKSGHKTKLVSD
jgi:hypothetical protein